MEHVRRESDQRRQGWIRIRKGDLEPQDGGSVRSAPDKDDARPEGRITGGEGNKNSRRGSLFECRAGKGGLVMNKGKPERGGENGKGGKGGKGGRGREGSSHTIQPRVVGV